MIDYITMSDQPYMMAHIKGSDSYLAYFIKDRTKRWNFANTGYRYLSRTGLREKTRHPVSVDLFDGDERIAVLRGE